MLAHALSERFHSRNHAAHCARSETLIDQQIHRNARRLPDPSPDLCRNECLAGAIPKKRGVEDRTIRRQRSHGATQLSHWKVVPEFDSDSVRKCGSGRPHWLELLAITDRRTADDDDATQSRLQAENQIERRVCVGALHETGDEIAELLRAYLFFGETRYQYWSSRKHLRERIRSKAQRSDEDENDKVRRLLGVSRREILSKNALRTFRGKADDIQIFSIRVDPRRLDGSQCLQDLLVDDAESRRQTTAGGDDQHALGGAISSLCRKGRENHGAEPNQREY